MSNLASPVPREERIRHLDILRGVAVLGILLMNIIGFAFYGSTYVNPTVAGGSAGPNLWAFGVNAIFVDGKMRGIFSLLFGAGIVLFASRMEQKGLGMTGADLYFRRMVWLGVFGVIHAVFLWWGEILFPYALAGLLLFVFRNLSVRALFIWTAVFVVAMTGGMTYDAFDTQKLRNQVMQIATLERQGKPLTDEQTKAKEKWAERMKSHAPDAKELEKDRKAFTSYSSSIPRRIELIKPWHNQAIYSPKLWDFYAMMLLGMALLKCGFLTGSATRRTLITIAVLGYLIGLPLAAWSLWNQWVWKFDIVAMAFSFTVYEPSRIAICLAHVSVLILLIESGVFQRLFSALAAAGQMAFSNYVLQSVLCTLFFTVLGYYGRLERYQVYYVVGAIWILQLLWSPWWLQRYRFGPLEWCWRSLTYWCRQPMRLAAQPVAAPAASAAPAEG